MFKPGQLAPIEPVVVQNSINVMNLDQTVLVKLLNPKGQVPKRNSSSAAGYDLYSSEDIIIEPHTRNLISTDIAIAVPYGTYGRIAPRSGLSVKHGIDVGAGVVDEDYRGNVKILLINHSDKTYEVKVGDRIAQLVLESIQTPKAELVKELPDTERGIKGFGSTGTSTEIAYPRVMAIKALRKNRIILSSRIMAVRARETETIPWAKELALAGANDPHWKQIKDALESGRLIENYSLEDGLVLFKNRIYIPDSNDLKLRATRQGHDAKVAGHFGRDKTLELISRNYYWPNLDEWVREYVRTCDDCQRNKTRRHKKYGRLQPLDVPYRPWEHISMDFITDLPKANGYDQI